MVNIIILYTFSKLSKLYKYVECECLFVNHSKNEDEKL